VLFALYLIFFVGGIVLMAVSFNVPPFQGVVFFLGILLVTAALATPIAASGIENRQDR
jgi:hypothetical protein